MLDQKNLWLARFSRLHLENNNPVERYLMKKLQLLRLLCLVSYPGYFDISVGEMDEYVCQLSPDPMELESQIADIDITDDIMHVQLVTQISPPLLLASASSNAWSVASPSVTGTPTLTSQKTSRTASLRMSKDALPTKSTTESAELMDTTTNPQSKAPSSPSTRSLQATTSFRTSPSKPTVTSSLLQAAHTSVEAINRVSCISHQHESGDEPSFESVLSKSDNTQESPNTPRPEASRDARIPPKEQPILRIEARWAPKDFTTLTASKALMYTCFTPILSSFNSTHPWVVEWQTDQLAKATQIEPTQVDQFMSIRCVASTKQKCFYFSFRLQASGSQFFQVLQSNDLQSFKQYKRISFDPSSIPPTHGAVT